MEARKGTRPVKPRCNRFTPLAIWLALCAPIGAAEERGARLGEAKTSQWRFGVVVRATGATTGVKATLPVPMDWPEQTVEFVKEEKSPGVGVVTYRTQPGGVKQMIVAIPRMAAGEEVSAIVTFEIEKREIRSEEHTSELQSQSNLVCRLLLEKKKVKSKGNGPRT